MANDNYKDQPKDNTVFDRNSYWILREGLRSMATVFYFAEPGAVFLYIKFTSKSEVVDRDAH